MACSASFLVPFPLPLASSPCTVGVAIRMVVGKEEAVVLWPRICSTIASFRYYFILGTSCFLTVCETTKALSKARLSAHRSVAFLKNRS